MTYPLAEEITDWRQAKINNLASVINSFAPDLWEQRRLRLSPLHDLALQSHIVFAAKERLARGDNDVAHSFDILTCDTPGAAGLGWIGERYLLGEIGGLLPAVRMGSETPLWLLEKTAPLQPPHLVELLEAAIAEVDGSFPEFAEIDTVSTLVLMRHRPFSGACNSWTSRLLPGTIYLDYQLDPVLVAKDIVHEAAHNWLNQALDALHVRLDPDRRFYSPWKQEPRTIYGIVHAGFAFSSVVTFLGRALAQQRSSQAGVEACWAHFESNLARLADAYGDIDLAVGLVPEERIRKCIRGRLEAALREAASVTRSPQLGKRIASLIPG